ncbi:CG7730 [Drosophila busckii]|uniref:CG7730 n=1 Tax=Drosophila busckii TaxID=30019 RepID=A0A0M4EI97_DROBS|nr:uncharacterized protein LOC108600733 [Drosophila busckii]ALC43551.1 CG7730 [Drosophila busckii]
MSEAEANNNSVAQSQARTILDVQQSFAESLAFSEDIIWDLLSEEQAHVLRSKIANLLRCEADTALVVQGDVAKQKELEKQKRSFENMREILFNSVWEQRKYTNRQSLTSIFYVLVATDEEDHNIAQNSRKWSCHPVFRARRCVSGNDRLNSSSSDCCMIFVDEVGRVYQNWKAYVENNELPAGIMVAPRRGVYTLVQQKVMLENWQTPAGSTLHKALGHADKGAAFAGFGAALVPLAALIAPVAAPLMAGAAVVGLASAGYATLRSGSQLIDRSRHEQSINVTDRAARGQWIGVVAGGVGLGAAGATSVMTAATSAGREVSAITQMAVNGMNISSIMISGTGLANGIIDLVLKTQDGDDISAMDVLQLSASLVLFTHSVYNFKLASTIINETANSRIAGYRETLSNRQRKMFDKISKETIRTKGATQGRMDIIRNVNEMPSRQEFNDLYKINKDLNKKGVRPSFASNGKGIVLNDQVQTSGAELRASVQHGVGADVLGQVSQPIPNSHHSHGAGSVKAAAASFMGPSRLLGPGPNLLESTPDNKKYALGVLVLRISSVVINGVVVALKNYGESIFEHIINAESFETVLLSLADNLSPEIMKYILFITETFMDAMWEELNTVLKFYISSESVMYRIGKTILDKYRNYTAEQLYLVYDHIFNTVKDYFLSLNPNSFGNLLTKCTVCEGFYKICSL